MGLADQAARLLAFDELHHRFKQDDPRRIRFMREWAVALARGPCNADAFLYAYDTSPENPTFWQPGQTSWEVVHFVAGVVGGELVINIESTHVEGEKIWVRGHRFNSRRVPQRVAPWAAFHALKRRVQSGDGEVIDGVRFMGDATRDEEGWRSHAYPLTQYLLSMDFGALWPTFIDHRLYKAHRWAWMARWFSRSGFEFEVERNKAGVQFIVPEVDFRRFDHEEAVERAIQWASSSIRGWVTQKWPDTPEMTVRLSRPEIEQCLAIIKKANDIETQIENRLGPTHIDMANLRKPPWATLQQHLCHHLVRDKGLTWAATAKALGISTPQQVGQAVKTYEKRKKEHKCDQ